MNTIYGGGAQCACRRTALKDSQMLKTRDAWFDMDRYFRDDEFDQASPFDQVARAAGIPLLEGSSVKAALDVDWTDLNASHEALQRLLGEVGALSSFIATHLAEERDRPPLDQQLATLRQVSFAVNFTSTPNSPTAMSGKIYGCGL